MKYYLLLFFACLAQIGKAQDPLFIVESYCTIEKGRIVPKQFALDSLKDDEYAVILAKSTVLEDEPQPHDSLLFISHQYHIRYYADTATAALRMDMLTPDWHCPHPPEKYRNLPVMEVRYYIVPKNKLSKGKSRLRPQDLMEIRLVVALPFIMPLEQLPAEHTFRLTYQAGKQINLFCDSDLLVSRQEKKLPKGKILLPCIIR